MKRIRRFFLILLLLLIVVYIIGPRPSKPDLNKDLPSISASIGNIESYVRQNDASLDVKPDNHSRIIWADSLKKERTEYCVLYLHGFSASWYEAYPVHINFAGYFGSNLYVPRLYGHGLVTEDALLDMNPDALWESAKEALMIARSLGKKVIIMSTSTGGTLGLKLAADFPEYVSALILYSPNIKINNNMSFLLSKPWGLQFGRKNVGGKYMVLNEDIKSIYCQYWYCKYRVEAQVYLQQLLDAGMNKETFAKVVAPVFLGYYYKNDKEQDDVVKVSAMLDMFEQLGTIPAQKVKVAFPEAGGHVIACQGISNSVQRVSEESTAFALQVLKMAPAKK